MPLISWTEVRDRAIRFSREWSGETSERAEKQTFWNEFFEVFGLRRRNIAVFEQRVTNIRGKYGSIDIDVFAPGSFLVEHKSAGKSLDLAASQAFAYTEDLRRAGDLDACPRFIILSDFSKFELYDLEPDDGTTGRRLSISLADLHKHVREFAFIRGEQPLRLDPEDPANINATRHLAGLRDALAVQGYEGHALERYLVRILFCLFAEDTGIFEPGQFTSYINTRTRPDGSDLGHHLAQLFEVLDQEKRLHNLDEELAGFPHVNGGLFAERLPLACFDRKLREELLNCCEFYWAKISPAVFGSLFQEILEDAERRQIGAHYTSERDILKVLHGLFLDEWQERLDAALSDRSTRRGERIRDFLAKLRRLRIFDPACGCGNFLIIAYRELRRLETRALMALHAGRTLQLDVRTLAQVDVDQFYGLELREWPIRIAEVGLWLVDHQCNLELAEALGQSFRRLPLSTSPTLRATNALREDWRAFLPPSEDVLLVGNPPFVGKHYQSSDQRADIATVLTESHNKGDLDYVTCWFIKAGRYLQGTRARCAFVSTNSITQGEQVPIIWRILFDELKLKIHFAHRTFKWTSEARGRAHVHVVIIGFAAFDCEHKRLFDYPTDNTDPVCIEDIANIGPYLVPGPDQYVVKARSPLVDGIPEMRCGNKPSDGGNLLFTDDEYEEFLSQEPASKPLLRRFTGSDEFINGDMRWCLWLRDTDPATIRKLPRVRARVEAVRRFRLASTAKPTRAAADRASEFFYISQPASRYIAVPEVSSERRRFIPIGYLPPKIIASNKIYVVANSSLFMFGVLLSTMHMAWVRTICGRLKSDFQYSGSMVYNTFPWLDDVAPKLREAVETAAQGVLDVRKEFPKATLADLYDPLHMPSSLARAHNVLDRAVERCYRKKKFTSDLDRFEFLFARYQAMVASKSED